MTSLNEKWGATTSTTMTPAYIEKPVGTIQYNSDKSMMLEVISDLESVLYCIDNRVLRIDADLFGNTFVTAPTNDKDVKKGPVSAFTNLKELLQLSKSINERVRNILIMIEGDPTNDRTE